MAHREAEIVMPVGAMEGMPFGCEETAPWDAHQWNDIIRQGAGSAHVPGGEFIHDVVVAGRSGQQNTLPGGDLGGENEFVRFVTRKRLRGQVDIDPFLTHWHIRGKRCNL